MSEPGGLVFAARAAASGWAGVRMLLEVAKTPVALSGSPAGAASW